MDASPDPVRYWRSAVQSVIRLTHHMPEGVVEATLRRQWLAGHPHPNGARRRLCPGGRIVALATFDATNGTLINYSVDMVCSGDKEYMLVADACQQLAVGCNWVTRTEPLAAYDATAIVVRLAALHRLDQGLVIVEQAPRSRMLSLADWTA